MRGGLAALAVASALAAGDASNARAEAGVVHPELLRASAAARAAKGPAIYAALRDLWRLWDRVDPTQVEEAIQAISEAKTTPPPAKVYADLLAAYARRRRGDLDGATSRIKALGFVGKWIVVGPFDNENKAGFHRPFPPEQELFGAIDLARPFDGKGRQIRARVLPDAGTYGWVDFGTFVRPREEICLYATTFVKPKAGTRAPRPISIWAGAAGAMRVFWNGEAIIEDTAYRELDTDRFAAKATLAPGSNRLMVKVCGAEEAPKLAVRIADDKGAPDLGVDVIADPAAAGPPPVQKSVPKPKKEDPPAKAANGKKKGADPAPKLPPKNGVEGPIQELERLVAGPKPPAAALETYARYLAATGGDNKSEHRARDLARRAAETEPTVARLLLAGELAEDKNQQRAWTERAEALAGPGHKNVDVLLRKAELKREGVNWRDAVPVYEEILAADPDNIPATLGLVELYIEAGLKRTATSTLERALARQPKSVALLRAYAAELRVVGRDTEAGEAAARYNALRFDDVAFLNDQVDLALARRDNAAAERWLGRLLATEPDSPWAQGFAARTYLALGQRPRALAAYQRALALAPEDVPSLRALSDFYGAEGKVDEQKRLLRQILAVLPQAKDVREYLEHIEPPKPRMDEAFAWAPDRFLPMRDVKVKNIPQRTLRSLTVSTVFPNGLGSRFRQVVFQPLTDEGAANARQYAFDYQGDRQTVTLRAAKVYRADGRVDEAIESGETGVNDPSMAMYTSTRTFYVNFPRLNAGDVVELRYRVEDVSLRNEIADYYGEVEYMGTSEPVASSEYVLIGPKSRTFHINADSVPNVKRETREEGDNVIQRLIAEDVPALAPEPVMPPWGEIMPRIHVSTFKTWDEVGAWYWGLARDQFDVDDEVRKKVREITKGAKDDLAKVKAVYRYATRLRYVALEFGLEGIRPRRCAQTLARGWGDCKDKATIIVTMLRELGIPSTIVLVRTSLRGRIDPTPASLAPFDHAIAYVPSFDLYLDGTAEHTGTTELPVMDRGAMALQINEGKPKLVRLPEPPPETSVTKRHLEVSLAADGTGQMTVDMMVTGAYAPDWRQRYLAEGTRRERALRDFAREVGAMEIAQGKGGVEVNDLDDDEQPVKIKVKGKSTAFARKEGDTLSIPAGPSHRLVADYASLSARALDIDLRAMTQREDEWVIKLPPGAKLVRPPSQAKLDSPYGRFSLTYEEAGGKITVKTSLSFKKSRIPASEYAEWRRFCEAADKVFGQRMAVSK